MTIVKIKEAEHNHFCMVQDITEEKLILDWIKDKDFELPKQSRLIL